MQILSAALCRSFLLLFTTVHILHSQHALANYAFGDSLFEEPKPNASESKKPYAKEDDPFSTLMHQCVQTLCEKTEPEKTFKHLYSEITYKASQSDFYESEIKPYIEKSRLAELQDLRGMNVFLDQLKNQKNDFQLDIEVRKALAVLKLTSIMGSIPTIDGRIELGPLQNDADFGPLIGKELDTTEFNRLVEDGTLDKITLDMASGYLLNRNYSDTFPFMGNSDNYLVNLLNNYGKGSRSYLLSFYDEMVDVSQKPGPHIPRPIHNVFDGENIKKRRDFFAKNFDSIVRFASISPFTFGLYETDFGVAYFDNFVSAISNFVEEYAQEMIPDRISAAQIHQIKERLKNSQELLLDQLDEDSFHASLSDSCQWKLNYLNHSLPSEEELKRADQQVTRAMVEFQSWVFQNFSSETATSMVNFIKSWEFFYPPTREEFGSVIKEFIEIHDPHIFNKYTPDQFSFLAAIYNTESVPEIEKFSSVEKIKALCESLNIRPVSDRASSVTGQVFLSWMALKNYDLTRSVVWHELGHVLSGLIRGDNQWNLGKKLLGEEFDFSLSVNSFLHYVEKRQCLGSGQEQDLELRVLKDQFLDWADAGELVGYFSPELVIYDMGSNYQVSNGTTAIGSLGKMTWRMEDAGSAKITERVNFTMVDGSLTEEDWADMVASSVGKSEGNHFCFMLKDRDHYYWDSEKKRHAQNVSNTKTDQLGIKQENSMTHSSLMYRLLNTHVNRSGALPRSCRQFLNLAPKYKDIKACN